MKIPATKPFLLFGAVIMPSPEFFSKEGFSVGPRETEGCLRVPGLAASWSRSVS